MEVKVDRNLGIDVDDVFKLFPSKERFVLFDPLHAEYLHKDCTDRAFCILRDFSWHKNDFLLIDHRAPFEVTQVYFQPTNFIVRPVHVSGENLFYSNEELKRVYEHFLISAFVAAPLVFHNTSGICGVNYEKLLKKVFSDRDGETELFRALLTPPSKKEVMVDKKEVYLSFLEMVYAQKLANGMLMSEEGRLFDTGIHLYEKFLSSVTASIAVSWMIEDVENVLNLSFRSMDKVWEKFKKHWETFWEIARTRRSYPEEKGKIATLFGEQLSILIMMDFYQKVLIPKLYEIQKDVIKKATGLTPEEYRDAVLKFVSEGLPSRSSLKKMLHDNSEELKLFKNSTEVYIAFILFRKAFGTVAELGLVYETSNKVVPFERMFEIALNGPFAEEVLKILPSLSIVYDRERRSLNNFRDDDEYPYSEMKRWLDLYLREHLEEIIEKSGAKPLLEEVREISFEDNFSYSATGDFKLVESYSGKVVLKELIRLLEDGEEELWKHFSYAVKSVPLGRSIPYTILNHRVSKIPDNISLRNPFGGKWEVRLSPNYFLKQTSNISFETLLFKWQFRALLESIYNVSGCFVSLTDEERKRLASSLKEFSEVVTEALSELRTHVPVVLNENYLELEGRRVSLPSLVRAFVWRFGKLHFLKGHHRNVFKSIDNRDIKAAKKGERYNRTVLLHGLIPETERGLAKLLSRLKFKGDTATTRRSKKKVQPYAVPARSEIRMSELQTVLPAPGKNFHLAVRAPATPVRFNNDGTINFLTAPLYRIEKVGNLTVPRENQLFRFLADTVGSQVFLEENLGILKRLISKDKELSKNFLLTDDESCDSVFVPTNEVEEKEIEL